MDVKIRELHIRVALFVASVASVAYGFNRLLLVHAPSIFNDPYEDMTHGWFVPVISLYVLWAERRKIAASVGSPSVVGLLAALPFMVAGFLGTRGIQIRLEMLGFAGLVWALGWTFFGAGVAKRTVFPAAYLLFCLPLTTYLDVVTVHLRLAATTAASALLSGMGLDIVRRGTMLMSGDGSFAVDVADPCSGIRSLFALTAITAGYAYFTQPTWLRRGLLFAFSVPIAFLGNVVRLSTIVLTGYFISKDAAMDISHDYSPFIILAVSIVLICGAGNVMSRVLDRNAQRRSGRPAPGSPPYAAQAPSAAAAGTTAFGWCVAVVATLLVAASMVYQAYTPDPVLCDAPAVAFGEIEGFESRPLEPSDSERERLPGDTVFVKRLYTGSDGGWFQVTAVIGGRSKSSIHRPELCLPSQGFQMISPRSLEAGGAGWHVLTLARRDAPPLGFAYTFFNQAGYHTTSHMDRIFRDVWDRSVLNRIDRWVMVTVNASTADDRRLAVFLSKLKEASECSN